MKISTEVENKTYYADVIKDGHRWVIRYQGLCHKLEFSPSDSTGVRQICVDDAFSKHIVGLTSRKQDGVTWKPCKGRFSEQ